MKKEPKLRFPEFCGEWEEKKLEEVVSVIDGDRGINYPKEHEFHDNEYCLFLNAKNVTKSGLSFNENMFITKEKDNLLSSGKLKRNDIVITSRGTVGNVGLYDESVRFENIRINSGMLIFRKKVDDEAFIYQYLKSSQFERVLRQKSFGSAQPQLTKSGVCKFKINLPSLPEQQKIADFLSTIDSQLETKEQEIENLEGMKKGFMQKIFSQEMRFKDEKGEEYPEWEEKKLGEIGEIQSNGVDKKIHEEQKEVYLLNYLDVYKKRKVTPDNVDELMRVTATEQQLIEKDVRKGDVFFTPSSETKNDIGYSMAIKYDIDRLVYSYHIVRFRPKDGILDVDFSDYFANDESVRKQLVFEAQGVQRFTLSKSAFENLIVTIPSLPEQQKIANFLSLFDEKIEIEKGILETLKEIKKGLLQQMFV